MWNTRRILFIIFAIIFIFVLIAGTHALVKRYQGVTLPPNAPGTTLPGNGPITIILAPHFDDAVLPLGGLLARHDRPALVATFFTGAPAVATSTDWDTRAGFTDSTIATNVRMAENQNALGKLGVVGENYGYLDLQYGRPISSDILESTIAQDIQALLVANTGRAVNIYGPSTFGAPAEMTHPDHQILHDAFTDVAQNFPAKNVRFFYYEDYPYVTHFASTSVISLQKYLENSTGFSLNEIDIPLSAGQVAAKISALKQYGSQIQAFTSDGKDLIGGSKKYTSTRCAGQACEVVYQIIPGTSGLPQ